MEQWISQALNNIKSTASNLFNQGGQAIQQNVVRPVQQDIQNWGMQNPQAAQQITNPQIPQPISDAFNAATNFHIPTEAIPFIGAPIAAMQRNSAIGQAQTPQAKIQAFQQTPTFTPGQVGGLAAGTWQGPASLGAGAVMSATGQKGICTK